MKKTYVLSFILHLLVSQINYGQPKNSLPKGNLFIIGGGDRNPELIQALFSTAKLTYKDYIVVLPMSGEEPDSSFFYIKADLIPFTTNKIANLNFTKDKVNDVTWLDSLKRARLIFITGGDQSRFMNIVLNTPITDAIRYAYNNGATIAGTSAGAAVMSKEMITGNEISGDSAYSPTFKKLHANNAELKQGLGLLSTVIIDQHFIVRSRYNRLISALQMFPLYTCIGIDESTAIIVHGKKVSVVGKSQVVVLADPENLSITGDLIKWSGIRFSIYTNGDSFSIR